ncbi:MAG: peptidylprolyl isomerase [Planctomycetes bacterium]|nr:peptidylprolyl isomerase [Planctomycetota bacterium]
MPQDVIGPETVVSLHYTLRNDAGSVIDTSREREPLEYLHGVGEIVPGLERALTGKAPGAKLAVVVPPEDGYGPRDPNGKQEFPREDFPEDLTIEPGMQIVVEDEDGEEVPCWVLAADARVVTLDLNHPLAGERLHFDVEVVAVRAATAEELEHGHAHGPHGHGHDDEDEDADI